MRNILLAALLLIGCSTVTPGEVVVAVDVCADSSTSESNYTVIRSGRYWPAFAWCTDHYDIVSREQRAVWTKSLEEGSRIDQSISFAGGDGQSVNIDVGVGFVIGDTDADVIRMVNTFGFDVSNTIDGKVRDAVRDSLNMCASKYTVQDIYGEKKDPLMQCAKKRVQDEFNAKGLYVTRMTLNSRVRLPERVRKEMEAATAAAQETRRVTQEVERTKAEGLKTVAAAEAGALAQEAEARGVLAAAEGQAKANKVLAQSITSSLIQLKKLDIEMVKAKQWDGKLPTITGGGEGALILDVTTVAATK